MNSKTYADWASLAVQWLRICLAMPGAPVQSLVQEDLTYCGAGKPVCHTCWSLPTLDSVPWGLCPGVCFLDSVPLALCPGVCALGSVLWTLCPGACALDLVLWGLCPGAQELQLLKPEPYSLCFAAGEAPAPATREWPLFSATRESLHAAPKTRHSQGK